MKKTILEEKVKELGGRLIPFKKWDDNIADDIKEEGKLSTEVVNGKVLLIDGDRELAHAKFGKKEVQVCYKWVPLWRFHKYQDCFVEKWTDLFKKTVFFATMLDECNLSKDGTVAILKHGGFKVADFEGF